MKLKYEIGDFIIVKPNAEIGCVHCKFDCWHSVGIIQERIPYYLGYEYLINFIGSPSKFCKFDETEIKLAKNISKETFEVLYG